MIKYKVGSRELIDVVNDLGNSRLVKSPYFQRNLVWRDLHKVDFIKTILMGLPFPQIFVAKGEIDLESMKTFSYVVDGQQRLSAIQDYVKGKFSVDEKLFEELGDQEKEDFFKYQIPIIDLDLKKDDPVLKDIFQRLNRTFYALSAIERQSSEYAASDLMITAKILADQFFVFDEDKNGELKPREIDPLVPKDVIKRAKKLKVTNFQKLILGNEVFTVHEIARQVPLSFNLNLLATCTLGWYNRNSSIPQLLVSEAYNFEFYSVMVAKLEKVAEFILQAKFKSGSYWYNKANLFSLMVLLYKNFDSLEGFDPLDMKWNLEDFEKKLPPSYVLAAKEAVNNKKERLLRDAMLSTVIFEEV
jgi:hypothetical protein